MIKKISHYMYETEDGESFTDKKNAETHEKVLILDAVWMVWSSANKKARRDLVFSTKNLAEE